MMMQALFLFLLLLGHTHSATTAASSLGVLTPHTETPVVTQATMGPDLLHSLQVLT